MEILIKGMLCPEIYDHPVEELKVIETHISWVILTGPYAYKLKKPVDLGFADFNSLERRRYFCNEEIRLNQRLAPELYLGVRPLFGTREQPTFRGSGEPIEFAVQMQQFDQRLLLPSVLAQDELHAHQIERLAREIAKFHRTAAVAQSTDAFGTAATIRGVAMANLATLEDSDCDRRTLAAIRNWTEAEYRRCESWFEQRHRDGFIRECHGDMHLGNMVLLNDQIRLFDCLEFNADLRWTDVMAEVAFLVMDFQTHGRTDLGITFLNTWLEQSGDYQGLNGWRWYLAYRALVRAKVAALRLQQGDLTSVEQAEKQSKLLHYLDLATSVTNSEPKTIILMHGLSGSGKSYVSEMVCQQLPAIHVRSDIERKRLFHRWGTPTPVQLTGDMYAASVTEHIYDRVLADLIPPILQAGFPTVIDAASLQAWQRHRIREVAQQEQARFVILDIQAPVELLRTRLNHRRSNATVVSDADVAVLEHQRTSHEPLSQQELSDTITVRTDSPGWWTSLKAGLQTKMMLDEYSAFNQIHSPTILSEG